MKISESLNDALNFQARHESRNMFVYKAIASYFDDMQLKNLAKKFYDQADEEYGHFTKVVSYINDRVGGKYVVLDPEMSGIAISSPMDVAQLYMDIETSTTESLESIADMIWEEKSYIDSDFIIEMLKMQVKEEDEADEFAKKFSSVSDLVLFDATLGD